MLSLSTSVASASAMATRGLPALPPSVKVALWVTGAKSSPSRSTFGASLAGVMVMVPVSALEVSAAVCPAAVFSPSLLPSFRTMEKPRVAFSPLLDGLSLLLPYWIALRIAPMLAVVAWLVSAMVSVPVAAS